MSESQSDVPGRALQVGATFDHYRIQSFIGAGGMGEVYRAHDLKLGRDVAVKVLPVMYDANAERVRRFTHEVKTTGRIIHPNIVSVFDAGEVDGRPFLVTELLEGETLRSYLHRSGPLAVREVVEFGLQITRGLAAAHDKGVIHRDLKPANVFVTRDGHLKILDFGLAKLIHPQWERDEDTISAVSLPGTVLGSAGYMSPEQVEARPIDHRSDIFSLGAILYEMLTGARAFSSSSVPATLSAILKDEPPDVLKARSRVPVSLALIVRRCLEKSAENRFQSARDLAFSLEELMARSDVSLSSAAMSAIRNAAYRARSRPVVTISTAAVIGLVIIAAVTAQLRSSDAVRSASGEMRVAEVVRVTSNGRAGGTVALSPDAKYVVAGRNGELWLTHVPTGSETRLLPQPTGNLIFSPDGNYIYFTTFEKDGPIIARVPILGGPLQPIVRGVEWGRFAISPDGAQLAFMRESKNGQRSLHITASNGEGDRRVTREADDRGFVGCAWSPDGSRILCSVDRDEAIEMVDVDVRSGAITAQRQLQWMLSPQWMPDGRAIVGPSTLGALSQIWAISYPDGKPSPLTNDVSEYFESSVSRDGTAVAVVRSDTTTNLWLGSTSDASFARQLTTGVNTYDGNYGVATTPDGRIVWASGASGHSIDLWICDADGKNRRRLTTDDHAGEKWPNVSADGKSVVYIRSNVDGPNNDTSDVWRIDIDGASPRQLTTGRRARYPSWDGDRVLFNRAEAGIDRTWTVPAAGGAATPLFDDPRVAGAVPSPDGKWFLVGVRDDKGRHLELRARTGAEKRVFPYWGMLRRWRRDGEAFAFVREGNLWVQELSANKPQKVTSFGKEGDFLAWGFDWLPDGKTFVYARRNASNDIVLLKLGSRR